MNGRAYERHGCAFCVALQRLAIRRRDLELIDAAERLSAEHLAADADREQFGRGVVLSIRTTSARDAVRSEATSPLPRRYPQELRTRGPGAKCLIS
jgi:hypothetical protein